MIIKDDISDKTYNDFIDELTMLMGDDNMVSYNDLEMFMDRWCEPEWINSLPSRDHFQFKFVFNGCVYMLAMIKQDVITESRKEQRRNKVKR